MSGPNDIRVDIDKPKTTQIRSFPVNHKDLRLSFADNENEINRAINAAGSCKGLEEFIEENGYGFEWCMAFKCPKDRPKEVPFEAITILQALNKAGLFLGTEFDNDGELFFIKIAASLERLRHHADCIDFKMLVDPDKLEEIAAEGVPVGPGIDKAIEPFRLPRHEHSQCKYKPTGFVYFPYQKEEPKTNWFYIQPGKKSPFRTVHRLKLIKSIITSKHVEDDVVARMNVRGLVKSGVIAAFFPIHDKARVKDLEWNWVLNLCSFPWNLPIQKIRGYFGEKVTLYFAFVGHFTTQLIVPALCGLWPFVALARNNFSEQSYNHRVVGCYGLIVALWAIVMLELWKRKQRALVMRWGMIGFEDEEQARPEFKGEPKQSMTSDRDELDVNEFVHAMKQSGSAGVITTLIGVVIAAVVGTFAFRFAVEKTKARDGAATLASILNGIQVAVLNALYSTIAVKLTKWENHKTDTAYQDSLITKLFAFQAVNSYASMIYIAFIQPYTNRPCLGGNCIGQLANNLTTIFITRLVSGNVTGVFIPMAKHYLFKRKENKKETKLTELEKQFNLAQYDIIMDLLFDYAQMAIQFGYAVLFVISNPIVPLLALISSYVEIRGDGFKLLKIHRRAEPGGVEDIGTWQSVFTLVAGMSIVSNAALICFSTKTFQNPHVSPIWLFIILQWLGFGLMIFLSAIIPDQTWAVQIQTERVKFWNDKLILQVEEEKMLGDDGMLAPLSPSGHNDIKNLLPEDAYVGAKSPRSSTHKAQRLMADLA